MEAKYSYLYTYFLYGSVRNVFDACRYERQVGGGWALEIESFLSPVKWHRADRPVPFGAQSSLGRYVFGSEISYNKAPPRLPGLGC